MTILVGFRDHLFNKITIIKAIHTINRLPVHFVCLSSFLVLCICTICGTVILMVSHWPSIIIESPGSLMIRTLKRSFVTVIVSRIKSVSITSTLSVTIRVSCCFLIISGALHPSVNSTATALISP